MTETDAKLSLKLLVDKKANKVGKDFVDFLFNLLSLPVDAVVRLITNATMVGCVGNLCQSIEDLNPTYMQPHQNKDLLSKPHLASVKGLVTYMVTDDLSVSPMSMISGVNLLNKFNFKDFGALEERMVEFGINEGIELLKASLLSKDALAAFLLPKQVEILLVDAKRNKVVFAEAGKDFVDFLLNLLALPVGTVTRLLSKSTMVGCIANLYDSLEKLDGSYLQPNQNKDSLLKPTVPTQVTNPNFLLAEKPEDQKLYFCQSHPGYVSDIRNSVCSNCRSQGYGDRDLNQEVKFVVTNCSTSTDRSTSDQGGYVKGLVAYMVTDDLSVSPMSMVSGVGLLNKLNIKDFSVLKERVVEFGISQGVELLKASLLSNNALTAVFLLNQEEPNFGINNDDDFAMNGDDNDGDVDDHNLQVMDILNKCYTRSPPPGFRT
ncbi:unnamed protein product [Dovyalis caffra]|uniref:Uncharacterized protein n=1 Tax=Dovyalis caffra TaxID=77055 RepID=A0AAV1QYC4_9ROSI|nr:unnamed protein product [Dovyalis caffra]